MYKLIKLTPVVFAVINHARNVFGEGSIEDISHVMTSMLHTSDDDVDYALQDMAEKGNNCADFGLVEGKFLYSELLSNSQIQELYISILP